MPFLEQIVDFLVSTIGASGYLGIFVLMAIESSVIPLPSEIVMIPAGFLVSQGKMGFFWVVVAGTFGSILGSLVNYALAQTLGRKFIYGILRYFFISEEFMQKVERYFAKHGHITVFLSRFLPGVRHVISIPAGLAKMDMKKFLFYTGAGAAAWCSVLAYLGYALGQDQELIRTYLRNTTVAVFAFAAVIVMIYYFAGKYYFEKQAEKDMMKKR